MGRYSGPFGGTFRQFDAFGKTLEDVKVKTGAGGLLSLISLSIIMILTLAEFADYRKISLEPSIVVDKSRGEKLVANFDITFPRVPCYLLSLDVMDISGEHQNDIHHDLEKIRINKDGSVVKGADKSKGLKGDLEVLASVDPKKDYCGECYGGLPPESGCCNSCEEVREAYVRRGWSFNKPDGIEQCVKEGWPEKIAAQATEGCRCKGTIKVNKVIGNFHFSPGKSFQANAMHVHDLVPYLRAGTPHDFGHRIHSFSFAAGDQENPVSEREAEQLKTKLGIVNPLDGIAAHTEESNYMFQYFLKVVSTKFVKLNGQTLNTNQYSVTQYERDLSRHERGGTGHHVPQITHGYAGVPGVFFNYEISPMLVIHTETRQSLAHFLTDTCAIVGGILTIAGLIDGLLWRGSERFLKGQDGASDGLGFASREGKWL